MAGDLVQVESKGEARRKRAEAVGMQRALDTLSSPTTPQAPALNGVGSLLSLLQLLGGTSDHHQQRNRPTRPNQATRLRTSGTTPGAVSYNSSMPICGHREMCKTPHSNPLCRSCRTGCGGRVIPIKPTTIPPGGRAPGQPSQRTNANQVLQPKPATPSVGVGNSFAEVVSSGRVIKPNLLATPPPEVKPNDEDNMEVDSSPAARRLCPPNGKVTKALSYLEVLTSGSTPTKGADGVDHPVDAKPASSKIHGLEQQLALVTSSGHDNPDLLALLNKQLSDAKAEFTSAAADIVPLTEDKHTEHKLAFQKYNTWAKATLDSRLNEIDKEIAKLQSERQLVVDEQAEVVGFYDNAMTLLEKAAKAQGITTTASVAAAAPAPPPVQEASSNLANVVHNILCQQKEEVQSRFKADIAGQQLSADQLLVRALEFGFGCAASSAVGQIAAVTPPAASAPKPATPRGSATPATAQLG